MQTPPCVPGEQSRWRSLLLFSVKWLSPMDYCNQVSIKKIKSKFFWVVRMLILLTLGTKDMTFANRTHGANSVFWEDGIVKVLLEYLICLYANYVFCHFHLLDDFGNFFFHIPSSLELLLSKAGACCFLLLLWQPWWVGDVLAICSCTSVIIFVSSTAVHTYDFHIFTVVIHHLEGLFGSNIVTSSKIY